MFKLTIESSRNKHKKPKYYIKKNGKPCKVIAKKYFAEKKRDWIYSFKLGIGSIIFMGLLSCFIPMCFPIFLLMIMVVGGSLFISLW